MFSPHPLKRSVQIIKRFHRWPPVRQFHGTLPVSGVPIPLRIALPVAVGIIASSCAFVAFAPLCRLDAPSGSDVRSSSVSRRGPATSTEEDEHKWRIEEVLQAFVDSLGGERKDVDLLGLLAGLQYDSYSLKPGRKLDSFDSLIYAACQRLGQLRIKGMEYWGYGRGVQELRAERLAASENHWFEQWNPFGLLKKEDLPLTNEDIKTAVIGLIICRHLAYGFQASMTQVKEEGGPNMLGMKLDDPVIQEHIKSSEFMARYGLTEVWILCQTLDEAEKVIKKPEIKTALKKAGCDLENKDIQWMRSMGFSRAHGMLEIVQVEYYRYAAENIIRID
ncbi:hypothetical protein EG328_000977 [Venturia inaequalis]|uniref:Uncharacterized protein n=1 Tax=Venturia inaequalis TaxID=5025 RepID=A0A8H3Z3H4_VENIN|nr:hypothetical protein EG328_000977 [Venturia inaequalis]